MLYLSFLLQKKIIWTSEKNIPYCRKFFSSFADLIYVPTLDCTMQCLEIATGSHNPILCSGSSSVWTSRTSLFSQTVAQRLNTVFIYCSVSPVDVFNIGFVWTIQLFCNLLYCFAMMRNYLSSAIRLPIFRLLIGVELKNKLCTDLKINFSSISKYRLQRYTRVFLSIVSSV